MKIFRHAAPFLAALLLSACAAGPEALWLEKTTYKALPGWGDDKTAETLPALMKSCGRIAKKDPDDAVSRVDWAGSAKAWQDACAPLFLLLLGTDDETRTYVEEHFTPYAVYGDKGRDGLFTGYYEPLLKGAHEKRPPYIYPLYGRPSNMYTADLGAFHPDLKGRTITGRVEGEKFVPFYKRADIEDGKLEDTPILWVDNAVDAFFLHIQGSGRVELENGEVVHAGYAAQNGHAYTAIGKPLIERGEIPREKMSMQAIRAWLEAHPDDAEDIMNINQSYVFFRVIDGEGPLGAEGVPLTPLRSMAVDRKKIPYGAPIYIDAETPDKTGRMTRLMVAQDTGGAIKGAVRGDVFWGAGAEAANNAGIMKSTGQAYILLPKTLDIPKDKTWRWWHRLQTGTPQTTVYNK